MLKFDYRKLSTPDLQKLFGTEGDKSLIDDIYPVIQASTSLVAARSPQRKERGSMFHLSETYEVELTPTQLEYIQDKLGRDIT
jgi:hypothetical protein